VNDPFSLKGKRFLVAGGTRGIGRAITLQFARSGASVVANYVRDQGAADDLQMVARQEGLEIDLCRADLTSPKGMEQIEQTLDAKGTPLSGLVHCAATGVHKPLSGLTLRHFDWVFALNVRAFLDLVLRIGKRFSDGASIVAVSSEGAVRAVPFYTLVGSSKGALESMARHLAVELGPRGIRVNILAPGAVMTDAWDKMPDRERRLEEARTRSPMKRLVTVGEVAFAAQFLCSDAASGISGDRLVVDGGAGIVE
jgi:NAD(P)-dependent dehydrogenase (short-subunit alcohol dehydrogenase family)